MKVIRKVNAIWKGDGARWELALNITAQSGAFDKMHVAALKQYLKMMKEDWFVQKSSLQMLNVHAGCL